MPRVRYLLSDPIEAVRGDSSEVALPILSEHIRTETVGYDTAGFYFTNSNVERRIFQRERRAAQAELRRLQLQDNIASIPIERVNPRESLANELDRLEHDLIWGTNGRPENTEVRDINPEPTINNGSDPVSITSTGGEITSGNGLWATLNGSSMGGYRPFTTTIRAEDFYSFDASNIKPKKVSRYDTVEVGDRVQFDNGHDYIQKGYVESIENGYIKLREDRDNRQTLWQVNRHENSIYTILTKVLRINDKVIFNISRELSRTWYPSDFGIEGQELTVVDIVEPSESERIAFDGNRGDRGLLLPGIKKIRVSDGRHTNLVYSDEVRLVENDIQEEQIKEEEMKPLSKQEELQIPLNYPKVNLKHKTLGELKKQGKDNVYGYLFNGGILQFIGTGFKQEDKPYFKFNLVNNSNKKNACNPIPEDYDFCYDNDDLERAYNKLVKSGKLKEPSKYQQELSKIKQQQTIIKDCCIVKVNNYNDSGEMFGYRPTKKEMLNKYFKIEDIDYNYFHELSKTNQAIVVIKSLKNNRDLKFLISDLEFVIPDPSSWLKSYTKPKDRTIKEGSTVKVTNDKYGSVIKGETLKVKYLDQEKYILTIGTYTRQRRRDLVEENVGNRSPRYRGTILIEDHPLLSNKKSNSKTKINPNCNVWCLNDKGKEVKVKLKQLKVV